MRHLKMRLIQFRAWVVNSWDDEKTPCTVEKDCFDEVMAAL